MYMYIGDHMAKIRKAMNMYRSGLLFVGRVSPNTNAGGIISLVKHNVASYTSHMVSDWQTLYLLH